MCYRCNVAVTSKWRCYLINSEHTGCRYSVLHKLLQQSCHCGLCWLLPFTIPLLPGCASSGEDLIATIQNYGLICSTHAHNQPSCLGMHLHGLTIPAKISNLPRSNPDATHDSRESWQQALETTVRPSNILLSTCLHKVPTMYCMTSECSSRAQLWCKKR